MPFENVLRNYFASGEWTIEEGQSGWNNTTRFIEAEGRRWVLRIYETHKDEDKIRYEHGLLMALNKVDMPFKVPMPIRCFDGSTIVRLEDGSERIACLFSYIEGQRPEEGKAEIGYAFGVAAGQLSRSLAQISDVGKPIYPPYYEMDSAHPLCTPDAVSAFCFAPPIEFREEALVDALLAIGEALQRYRSYLPSFRTLPHQLIHGDINHSNSLVSGDGSDDRLAAVLDFEFCTWDLRAMEFAVIVSGLLSDEEALGTVELFLRGVGEQLTLEKAEAEAVPLLVQLRILDVFLHFLGRYLDGVDGENVLGEQIRSAYEGLRRLERIEDDLLQLSLRHLVR
ncbi:phosphotransferase [Cohnella herbarum]|uniref:Phosphotransferase n=1 Tax=Cohnella herbarum TaxID=2728023 RepID=A0A7Z2VGH6_9BACL|nr:phosphotransferase [Cohnella herbarum]QJD82659.1 phosphotransferase [Cohnella herbarum]